MTAPLTTVQCPRCRGEKTISRGALRAGCYCCNGTGSVIPDRAERHARGMAMREDRIRRGLSLSQEAVRLGIPLVTLVDLELGR